jgi:radical SAM protein with 4Fe4S-binding SPASM domain
MKRKTQYMDFSLFKEIVDKNRGVEFVLPFQWGEPLLHKDFLKMVKYATSKGIRVMFTTNGTMLNDDICRKIAESGAERITISFDGIGETHTKIRGFDYYKLREKVLNLKKIRDEVKSKLKIDISMVVFKETENDVGRLYEEWGSVADRVQLIPRFVSGKRTVRCRELWRGIIVVLCDGRVSICCADYEGEAIVGDARKQTLAEIWNSKKMRECRRAHIKGKFPPICENCNEYETDLVSKRFS